MSRKFEIAEISYVVGVQPYATGTSKTTFYVYSSGTSCLSNSHVTEDSADPGLGTTGINSAPFQLLGVYFHSEAVISTGVSVILDHPSGTTWDTVISESILSAEKNAAYIPPGDLIIPKGFGITAYMQGPNATGTTRHITIVVGY